MARRCDLCNTLFKIEPGQVCLEVYVVKEPDGTSDSWSDVDYCNGCSAKILDVIAPSLDGLQRRA